jgi:hypothetical protein
MKISNDEYLRRLREGKETALKFNAFVTAGAYDRLIEKAEKLKKPNIKGAG